MPIPSSKTSAPRSNLYGALSYASITLSYYAGFFGNRHYYSSEWMVPVVFGLGGIYAALGVLLSSYVECDGRAGRPGYFMLQCAILTGIVFISPSRDFVGILVLPALAQAIFHLRAWQSAIVGLYLFGISIAVWAVTNGWNGAIEATTSYATAFAFTVVFAVITRQAIVSREREAKLRAEVEAANQQLREHAAQTADLATTRERNRVAREIHDGVGHYLTVVKTQLDAAAALMPSQPDRALEAVTKAAKLAGDALDDVRRSVGTLRTDAARPPLPQALRELTQEAGLPVTVRVEGAVRALPPGIEHALFRSAQEGLTNIRKHAEASAAEVALAFRPEGKVTLAVTDNGRGVQPASGGGGFGLVGIRERIEVLGGRVESGNRSAGGFALTIEVPA